MVKTQVQIPDALFREAKRLAAENEMSFAEVVRRGWRRSYATARQDVAARKTGACPRRSIWANRWPRSTSGQPCAMNRKTHDQL